MLYVHEHFPRVVVQQSSVIRLWGHIQLKLHSPIKFNSGINTGNKRHTKVLEKTQADGCDLQ